MASQLTEILLICLLAAPLVAGQSSTTSGELDNGSDQANSQQQQQQNEIPNQTEQQEHGPFTSTEPSTGQDKIYDKNEFNDGGLMTSTEQSTSNEQDNVPKENEFKDGGPITSTEQSANNEQDKSGGDPNQQNQQKQIEPFLRPFMRRFFSLFSGRSLIDTIRQHRQNMGKYFEQLRQQAPETKPSDRK